MDAECDEDLLVVATASVGLLVMATCQEINQKRHHYPCNGFSPCYGAIEIVVFIIIIIIMSSRKENVGEVMDW